ncbi:MAG TPA: DUF4388 domain-containing protein [Thermoanaerobaculia bacterium]|nr:DUF4388 domain-containing protein [Thermoanaerobaculia bacterium]
MKNVFEAEGEIREVDPLAALVTCWRERTSGALRFTRGASESGFDLEEGEIVSVVSSDPRFDTAAILVRAGKLAADAVDRLAPQGGDPALLALQTGLLTRREWKWGEKIRAIEALSDVLSWNGGRYRFDAAAAPHAGEFRLPIPRLLLELFLRSRDRNLVDHQLGAPDQTLVRGERFDQEFSSFGLTADAESVVRLIDGRSTATEIADKAPAEEFAVRKLLAALVTLGLVHPVPSAPARAAGSEPAPPAGVEPEPVFPPAEAEPEPEPERDVELPEPTPTFEPSVLETSRLDSELATIAQTLPEPSEEMVELPGSGAPPFDRFDAPAKRPEWQEASPPSEPESGTLWDSPPEPPAAEAAEILTEPAPERRGIPPIAWLLGLLVAAVAAVLLWRARGPSPGRPLPAAAPTAAPAVTFPPPATAIPAGASSTTSTSISAAEAPTAAAAPPTAVPVASTSMPARAAKVAPSPVPARPTAAAVSAAPSEALPDSREGWARRAETDRKRLATDKRTRYAVQLELVCEVESLREAWKHDRGKAMWLLPVTHGGRDCFRVFWGRYPSLDAAKKGKTGIPPYFTTARNRPAVVAVR